MSHELRTPLNAILGFSELMSLDTHVTSNQKETLNIINTSGTHLLGMINDVLDISKIEAGRLELHIQSIELKPFLQEISAMINARATSKQLNFNLDIAPDTAIFIRVDSGKLRQVLINLLGNAIKFTELGTITLRSKIENAILTIEVIDTGVGIPADKLEILFKPFTQLTQQNEETKGTGLGLAISKSLIELMNGTMTVKSEWGIGSTFKIVLPVCLANAEDVTTTETYKMVKYLAPHQPDWRLLVVDDNADNRLLLCTLLTQVGFQVREVKNGQEAIHLFEQWQPHLIWMDMRMPVLDGYEATIQIRQLKHGDKVKIIALTASAFTEEHRNIIEAGCDTVLSKPFHVAELFAILAQYLDVKFTYQESDLATLSPILKMSSDMFDVIPLNLREALKEAALVLDIQLVETIITKIRFYSPNVAMGLQKLLKDYQFDEMIQLTKCSAVDDIDFKE